MPGGPPALTWESASDARRQRITNEVAPLVVRGFSTREIARELGISQATADRDARLCRDAWKERFANAGEEWRDKALATYEYVCRELAEVWETHKQGAVTVTTMPDGTEVKKVSMPDTKPLVQLANTVKEVTTLLGIRQADTVQQVAIESTTVNALAPLSQEDYQAMVANMGSVNVTPPRPAVDVEVSDDPAGG